MNEILKVSLLGLVQGFTEFLPVSSSGHLVILKETLKIDSPGAFLEAILHMGTMTAVIIYYWSDLVKIKWQRIKMIIIASIPAALIGFLAQDPIESLFQSTKLVGFALLVTAFINFMIDRRDGRKEKPDALDSLGIGFAQAFAIIPGISRSGSTIFAAKSLKLKPEEAAEFSFIISIPVIFGANILEFVSHGINPQISITSYFLGYIVAAISGFLAINLVLRFLREKKFKYFGVYSIVLGLVTIFFL